MTKKWEKKVRSSTALSIFHPVRFSSTPLALLPSSLQSHDGQGGAAETSTTDIASIQSLVQPWLVRSPFIHHHPPLLPPVSTNPLTVPQCLSISPTSFTESPINHLTLLDEVWSYEVDIGENRGGCSKLFCRFCADLSPAINPPSYFGYPAQKIYCCSSLSLL